MKFESKFPTDINRNDKRKKKKKPIQQQLVKPTKLNNHSPYSNKDDPE